MTSPLHAHVVFSLGPVPITEPVLTTWGVMATLVISAWLVTRRLAPLPDRGQSLLEWIVEAIEGQLQEIMHTDPRPFLPLLGTLALYITAANAVSVLPGLSAPTAALETPAALGAIVFVAAHGSGIWIRGLRRYLRGYLEPNPLLLPLNVLGEITRIFSLMVRLFGNMMSHELVIAVIVSLAGLFVPIPLMALSLLIGAVQAYIFTVLATVYVGAAVGTIEGG